MKEHQSERAMAGNQGKLFKRWGDVHLAIWPLGHNWRRTTDNWRTDHQRQRQSTFLQLPQCCLRFGPLLFCFSHCHHFLYNFYCSSISAFTFYFFCLLLCSLCKLGIIVS